MDLTFSSLATMQVQVPITARVNGDLSYDPTGDAVQMAFIIGAAKPAAADWHAGTWTTDPGPEYLAQCLVGPNGGVVLDPGTYQIWVKITDNPEQPVIQAGQLVIE